MTIQPFLFTCLPPIVEAVALLTDPEQVPAAIVVDWETRGKSRRQADSEDRIGTTTQLEADTPTDLKRVRALVQLPVICRINSVGPQTRDEIALAADLGANEILVPMVRAPAELDLVFKDAPPSLGVGVMVETTDAIANIADLASFPLSRAYIGLMDLALERRTSSIFTALTDGTVDRLAESLCHVGFGVAGLTLANCGKPIPARLLMAEMMRIGCSFSFMRRSFLSDLGPRAPGPAIREIRKESDRLAKRTQAEIAIDRRQLVSLIGKLNRVTRS